MEYNLVGKSVQVLINGLWTEGFIDEYHPDRGYHIQYFDGDSDWIQELDKNHVKIDQEDQGNRNEGKEDLDDINFFDENANEEEDELAIISNIPQTRRDSKPKVPPLDALKEQNMKRADEKVSARQSSRPTSSRSRRGEDPQSHRDVVNIDLEDDIMMKGVDDLENNKPRKSSSRQELDHKRSPRYDSNNPTLDMKISDQLNRTSIEDEDELAIISNSPLPQVHRNSKPKVPPLDPRKEESMKKADEKISSRPTTSRPTTSRPTTSRSRQRDEIMTNMDLTSEDELLMAADLDDDIMLRDVDDLGDNNHVVVHTYETEEESSPIQRQPSNRDLDHKEPKPTTSPRYEPAATSLDMENGNFNMNEQNLEEVARLGLDLEHYQMRSHDFILAQSPLLQTRSVLLVGSVLCATVQPSSSSTMKQEFNGTSQEEFFFRVLFIEGGNQPIMLRCKTPIFTSDTTIGQFSSYNKEYQPFWKENFYRCDLQMPLEKAGKGSSSSVASSTTSKRPSTGKRISAGKLLSTIAEGKEDFGEGNETTGYQQDGLNSLPFPVSGEILISVYKVRRNGGNDLMGQMIVDLKRMTKEGVYEYFNEICEGRSYSGKFPLTLPSNNSGSRSQADPVGEIELHLSIAWKVPSQETGPNLVNQLGTINTAPVTRPKSATASNASVAASKKPATATVATTVKKKTVEQPRKIVSAQARKQKEDQKRIEMENKKLLQAIQKNSGKSGTAYSNNPTISTKPLLNNFITPSITSDAKSVAMKDMKGKTITQEDILYQKYLTLYNQLKKNISDEEDIITSLKARYNNTNIQIKKYQASIEKAKLASQSGGTSVISRSSRMSRQAQQAPTSQTRRAESKTEREAFNRSEGKKSSDDDYDDKFEDDEGEKAKEEIRDPEYESIKEEYDVMQRLRRSLVDRIIKAKEVTQRFHIDQRNIETQRQAIKSRINAVLQYQQLQEEEAANTQSYFNENQTQFEKIQKQRENGKTERNNNNNNSKEGDDLQIFQTLFALEQEKQFYSELVEENSEYYTLQATYEELNQSYLTLQEKYDNLTSEISKLQEQKNNILLSQKGTSNSNSNSNNTRKKNKTVISEEMKENDPIEEDIKEKRELITFLQKLLIQSDLEERSLQYTSQMKENEIQLMYLQIRQKERDELKYQEINHLRSNGSLQTLSAISPIPLLSVSSGNRTNQNSADQLLHLSPSASQLKLNNSINV